MSVIRPFCALRPNSAKVAQVAAVPYDVVSRAEARQIAAGDSYSFLHVSRSEIDLPNEIEPYSDEVYLRARSNFEDLIRTCPFLEEDRPSLYLYRIQMGEYEQTGVVGTFSIDEYDSNQIRKHERTRKDKEDDRTRHICGLSAQTGPVFLAYRASHEVALELEKNRNGNPVYDFVANDSIRHTVWIISEPEGLIGQFKSKVENLYIADGHHRAAAASRVRSEFAIRNPRHQGDEDYNYFLAVAFPDNELRILPYHRVVKDLNQMSDTEFLEKLSVHFELLPGDHSVPSSGNFGMYFQRRWTSLILKRAQHRPSALDVNLLQDLVLGPILGIGDPRVDRRVDFVGGVRGIFELENRIDQGHAAVAFSLHPTRIEDVLDVSDGGGIMPPKSTWFEPKLRDGLFVHRISQKIS